MEERPQMVFGEADVRDCPLAGGVRIPCDPAAPLCGWCEGIVPFISPAAIARELLREGAKNGTRHPGDGITE